MTSPNICPPPPRTISHYEILAPLGRGGMGLVYLARDTRLQREIAIKCLRSELFEEHYIERFRREALLLAKLNHPNIVQIYDFIETPEQLALVMELVDGNNLHMHLREHIVPLSQRMHWLAQIAQGLAVAHDAGIIHRDLKPENILINTLNQAKISDLGIAKSQDISSTLTDHVTGSYCAMSPEQASGEHIDFKSDLFSLGILAYQLLCGAHPFGDTNNKLQMMQRIISQPPTPPSKYNPELAPEIIELLGQLLSKKTDNRPDNTHWVASQFEHLCHAIGTNEDPNDDTQALIAHATISHPTTNERSSNTQEHPTFDTETPKFNAAPKVSHFQSITNYLRANKTSLGLGLSILTVLVLWNLQSRALPRTPHKNITHSEPQQNVKPLKAYSQTEELNNGFNALKLFDRPGSLETAEKSFSTILEHSTTNAAAVAGVSLP